MLFPPTCKLVAYIEEASPESPSPSHHSFPAHSCASMAQRNAPNLPPLMFMANTASSNSSRSELTTGTTAMPMDGVEMEEQQACHSPLVGMNLAPQQPVKTLIFNYIYADNALQQTEYRPELVCPWCSLSCHKLFSLLKHMILCHPRFHFTYTVSHHNPAQSIKECCMSNFLYCGGRAVCC